jgi:chorismate mutase/prephenate dehydratase
MELKESRAEIDRIDLEIGKLLKKRFTIAGQIGNMKNTLDLEIEDLERDKRVLENYKKQAGGELDEGFIEELVELILKYSKEVQKS